MASNSRKILLIGWDAADWKVIHPLMEAGRMPALRRLVEQGVLGNISTLEPPFSPMLWTTVATGKYADKHGIHGFTEPDPEGLGIRPCSTLSRKTKAVWNILSQKGYKTHVVGWWPSNPAEPVNGIMVSNFYQKASGPLKKPWNLPAGTVHPAELSDFFAELRVHPEELGSDHLLPFVPEAAKINQQTDKRLWVIAKNIAEAASIHSAATWILETQPWDFMAVYLDGIDHFCHGFMKYHPPQLSGINNDDFELYKEVVNSAYQFHDMMLGRLLQLAGPEATIILTSDHGFHSDHLRTLFIPDEPAGPAEHHRHHGIFVMKGPGIRQDEIVFGTSLLQITPTILTLFGLPIGADMDGIPVIDAFEQAPNIATIPSWDQVNGPAGMHSEKFRTDPLANKAAIQQLIELGYIEDPGPNKQKAADRAETEIQYNLSRVYIGSMRFGKAAALLEGLVSRFPDEGRYSLRLAGCYRDMGRFDDSRACLQAYLAEAEKKIVPIEEIKTKYREKLERYPKQKERINKRLGKEIRTQQTLLRDTQNARRLLDDTEMRTGDPQQLLREFQQQLGEKVTPAQLHKLGKLSYEARQWDLAAHSFHQLLALDPHNYAIINQLMLVAFQKEQWDDAANLALDSIGLHYYQPLVHYRLGEVLLKLGNTDHAARAFEVSLKMVPGMGQARNRLIQLYQTTLGVPEKAEELKNYFRKQGSLVTDVKTEMDLPDELSNPETEYTHFSNPIVVVSGLPRSGTSLMMQMLVAGGIAAFTDQRRRADENNPEGYYEHEMVKKLAKEKLWLGEAKGKAVKVISHLLPHLPARHQYKVIFMLRDLSEVVASQHKMLVRDGKHREGTYPAGLAMTYRNQLQRAGDWLKTQHNIDTLYVRHSEAIAKPECVARIIENFLGKKMDIKAMSAVVKPELHREKAGK